MPKVTEDGFLNQDLIRLTKSSFDKTQMLGTQLGNGFYATRTDFTVGAETRQMKDWNGEVLAGIGLQLKVRDFVAMINGHFVGNRQKEKFNPAQFILVAVPASIVDGANHFLILEFDDPRISEGFSGPDITKGKFSFQDDAPNPNSAKIAVACINIPVSTTQVLASHIDNDCKKFLIDTDELDRSVDTRIAAAIIGAGTTQIINELNIAKLKFEIQANHAFGFQNMEDGIADDFTNADGVDAGLSVDEFVDIVNREVIVGGLPANLIALYRMDLGAGVIAVDSSGNGNNGAISGPVFVPGAAGFGKALDFSGSILDNVIIPGSISMNIITSALTLSMFINAPANFSVGFSSNRILCSNRVFSGPNRGWGMFTRKLPSGLSSLHGFVVTTSGIVIATGATAIDDGTSKHVAMVYDGTDIRLYVAGTIEPTTGLHPKVQTGTILPTLVDPYVLGNPPGFIGSNPWSEKMDEHSIFDIAKTPAEITTLASGPITGGATSATVVSVAGTATASPTDALIFADVVGTVTFEISRDNGVTFTPVTNKTPFTFGAEPAGTAMRWKAIMASAADKLKAVSLYWK